MSHQEHNSRAKGSSWHKFGHLLGLILLAVIVATVFAMVQKTNPANDAGRPVRIYPEGAQQQLQGQPIMVKTAGAGPLAKFGAQFPLPPLPGIPKNALVASAQVVGTKEGVTVWQVRFDDVSSASIGGAIYLVKIEGTAGGKAVPTCPLNRIFLDAHENTDIYGYRYAGNGAAESALLAIDVNNDNVPDLNFEDIFIGTFLATPVATGNLAGFMGQGYNVTFQDTAGMESGPGQFYAFVSNGGTIIDPLGCLPKCGDHYVDDPESCDPETGRTSSDGMAQDGTSSCTKYCKFPNCGDNVITPPDEVCDDGNEDYHDDCVDCQDYTCGDGFVHAGEGCDDGNDSSDDGCTDCQIDYGYYCNYRNYNDDHANFPESSCYTVCGDGIPAGFEQCDQSSATNGTSNTCCDSQCVLRGSEYTCRPEGSDCDVAETCDGATASEAGCPANLYRDSSTLCRSSEGDCDVEEYCTGVSSACPTDEVATSTTVCRQSDGDLCDLVEKCDGSNKSCPSPDYSNNGSTCSDDGNECTSDICENSYCSHPSVSNFTTCTDLDSNNCTNAQCEGGSCSEVSVDDGSMCGDYVDDYCYSGNCEICGDNVRDLNEVCDNGNSSGCSTGCDVDGGWSCLGDVGYPSVCTPDCTTGNTCSASTDDNNDCTVDTCNDSNTCTTSGTGAGWNANVSSGASCSDDGEYCTYDTCDGSGTCGHSSLSDGTACPSLQGGFPINNGHCSNGVCSDYCHDGTKQDWEECDSTDGGNYGPHPTCCDDSCHFIPANTTCREQDGVCDEAEYCDGSSGDCPSDTYAGGDTACRESTGQCDATEYCDGNSTSCPDDTDTLYGQSCSIDGNDCTGDFCSDGQCTHPNVVDFSTCSADDGSVCTNSFCESGACNSSVPTGDGSMCGDYVNDYCYSGDCEVCGDNVRDLNEDCDNGNSSGCSTDCHIDSGWSCTGDVGSPSSCTDDCVQGSACSDNDGNVCTTATCDSNHSCDQNMPSTEGIACEDDGNECNYDICDGSTTCSHWHYVEDGTACSSVSGGHCYTGTCQDTCGDGTTQAWEQCDEGGQNGTFGSCCESDCTVSPSYELCRDAEGECDVEEYCDGNNPTCPSDAVAGSSLTCGFSGSDECDLLESCDGINKECPPPDYTNNGFGCTDDGNDCTTDACEYSSCTHSYTGDFSSCGTDDGNVCTTSYCESGTCNSSVSSNNGGLCGDYTNDYCYGGTCDVCGDGVRQLNEACDNGGQAGCYTNCQVDDGWSCTGDVGQVSTCTDNCTPGYNCEDTDNNTCTVARCGDNHSCMQSGTDGDQSAYVYDNRSCEDDNEYCTSDYCDTSGNCTHPALVDGTSCSSLTNNNGILLTGHCQSGLCYNTCGDGTTQAWEQCDEGGSNGSFGSCCESDCTLSPSYEICRNDDGSDCDLPEYCTGSSGACPLTDAVEDGSTICRYSTGECDETEYCDGTNHACPSENYIDNGDTCATDNNDCTNDACSYNSCSHSNVGDYSSCGAEDGNVCTASYCMSGSCNSSVPTGDGNDCGYSSLNSCYSGTCEQCGDGILGHFEQCDNGNGPGCSSCSVSSGWSCMGMIGMASICTDNCAVGNSCNGPEDSNSCTQDVCDSNHNCVFSGFGSSWNANVSSGSSCTNDYQSCTFDGCDGNGSCTHSSYPDGSTCDGFINGRCLSGICNNYCGDGYTEPWEQCDLGNGQNGSYGACCDTNCNFISGGSQCRGSNGVCDIAEYCTGSSGSCPSDTFAGSSSSCRASMGECDATEYCNGSGASCPSDQYWATYFNSCGNDSNDCTSDYCSNNSCSHPSVTDYTSCSSDDGNACTAAACLYGGCTQFNVSNGVSCSSYGQSACYYGSCEVCGDGIVGHYEQCDNGNSSGCSSNCLVDYGWSCSGTIGQPSSCTDTCATGNACSSVGDDGNVCTTNVCSDSHMCMASGSGTSWNANVSSGASCTDDGEWCTYDECDGNGSCSHSSVADGTSCPTYDNGHCYSGVCGNHCGDGIVDSWEQCDEGGQNGSADSCCNSTCNFVGGGTECRGTAGDCDQAEYCTGSSGSCPSDGFNTSSMCRPSTDGDVCDPTDYCTGASASCPDDSISQAEINTWSCTTAYDWMTGYSEETDCHVGICNWGVCDQSTSVANGTMCSPGLYSYFSVGTGWCYDATCYNCGDGVTDPGEECDDGASNGTIGDCCDGACLYSTSVCHVSNGDSLCDPDVYCTGSSTTCPVDSSASSSCVAANNCGNGVVDSGEQCDDGGSNGQPGDCCDGSCNYADGQNCSDGDGNTCTYGSCSGGSCSAIPAALGSSCPGGYCSNDSSVCGGGECCFGIPV